MIYLVYLVDSFCDTQKLIKSFNRESDAKQFIKSNNETLRGIEGYISSDYFYYLSKVL